MLGTQLAALSLTAAAVVASGCGGSSKTSSRATTVSTPSSAAQTKADTSTPQLPTTGIPLASGRSLGRAAWVKRAEAICTRANDKVSSVTASSTAEYATALPQLAVYERKEARELSKLVPPSSMASDWAKIVDGLWLDSRYTDQTAAYIREKNLRAARPAALSANALHEEVNRLAKRDGFVECAVSRVRRNSPTGR